MILIPLHSIGVFLDNSTENGYNRSILKQTKGNKMLKPRLQSPKNSALKALQREMARKNGDKLMSPKEVAKEIKAHDRLTNR